MIPKSYPLHLVQPMKDELLNSGFLEFTSAEQVKEVVQSTGTTFVVVNSVCGCSARGARPSAIYAIELLKKEASNLVPDRIYTVFAGYDMEETQALRELCMPYPASSPSMAFFKDGKLMGFLERRQIEGHTPEMIVRNIINMLAPELVLA